MITPYDYQEQNATRCAEIIREYGSCLDASETGVGKTVVAIRTAQKLSLTPSVITTKSGVPAWEAMLAEFGFKDAPVINWERARKANWQLPNRKNLGILDECQKAKNPTTQLGRLQERISDSCPTFLASATPFVKATETRAHFHALRICDTNRWYEFLPTIGGYIDPWRNNSWQCHDRPKDVARMHDLIADRMIKTKVSDIAGFQGNTVQVDSFGVSDPEKFNAIYRDISSCSNQGELQKLRKEIEHFRCPAMIELASNLIAEGNAVVAFFNYTAPLMEFADHFKCPVINGKTKQSDRKAIIDQFQDSVKPLVLGLNIRAGGESISLHDKVGIPRRSIISPTWSAQDLRQALGRIHRSGGVSPVIQKILYAGGTVEDRVLAVVRRKLAHLDQITDTDLEP